MLVNFINGYNISTFSTGKSKNFLSVLLSSTIDGPKSFNQINNEWLWKTMTDKNYAKTDILDGFYGGNGTNSSHFQGNSRSLSPSLDLNPFNSDGQEYSYTKGNNYYNEFVRFSEEMPQTQEKTENETHRFSNYTDLYTGRVNLYPDDSDALDEDETLRWEHTDNRDSLLSKTKELFRQQKINTIISRFHTENGVDEQDVGSKFGMSHGRNLLKRDAERYNKSVSPNGNSYDNPYCRVWTHHYKYDRLNKLIRPFVDRDDGVSLEKMHTWTEKFQGASTTTGNGWKNHNKRWNQSVLNSNGHVNITPKYGKGGIESLHTKQCMFSIENLAWKGMSPYEFERNLSWEQRGPMGGRIMWFPPYGISFQETTTAQWNTSSFIGRGEDVYTYVNTKRSGSLNFIMVVDHPSVVDYSTWYGGDNIDTDANVKDTDLLRFFAGCDSGDANNMDGNYSLFGETKPTPYSEHEMDNPIQQETEETGDNQPNNDEQQENTEATPMNIVFYVFYPNNYSGVYDLPNPSASENCNVNFAAYLINGVGTNKRYEGGNTNFPYKGNNKLSTEDKNNIITKTVDNPIDEDTYGSLKNGNGYEIYTGSGIGQKSDGTPNADYVPILGTTTVWNYYKCEKGAVYPMFDGVTPSKAGELPVYYYRPDGKYEVPSSKNDPAVKMNTYDDQLKKGNYEDKQSFGYNSSKGYDAVAKHFNENTEADGNDCLYAFTEIAAALDYDKYGSAFTGQGIVDEKRVKKLVEIFNNYQILEVHGFGSASSHSNSKTTSDNQVNLNANRYKSVANWLRSKRNGPFNDENIKWHDYEDNNQVTPANGQDVSASSAKLGRYAKIIITVQNDDKKKLSETSQVVTTTDESGNVTQTQETVQKSIDYASIEENEKAIKDIMTRFGKTEEEATSIYFGDVFGMEHMTDDGGFDLGVLNESVVTAERPEPAKPDMEIVKESSTPIEEKMNYLRYDQEYRFFKELKLSDPVVFDNLMQKLQYFDPAFHSMTPEGFNGRLAFLHQCTRQGNTTSASDQAGQATNLAFGRPPICVLRLGDFYNQMIVINSINMTYDNEGGVQWDLNPEGSGVQPLLAHISINFDFIGGGDMTGPIRRLQNAMTFNYYANQGLYDNRADWVERKWDAIHADAYDNEHYDGIMNQYSYLPKMDERKPSDENKSENKK